MKFTRMFLLKSIKPPGEEDILRVDPINYIKKLIITNKNIDLFINLICSILFVTSQLFFYKKNSSINFLISLMIYNIIIINIFIIVKILHTIFIIWDKYLRIVNIPKNRSRNSIKERESILSNKSGNNRNSINSINNEKFEPIINDIFKVKNRFDDFILKIYNILIRFFENELSKKKILKKNYKSNSLYYLVDTYPHTINSIFHFLQNILFLSLSGISLVFLIIYKRIENSLNELIVLKTIILIYQIMAFYSLFRLIFFGLQFLFNIFIFPIYFSLIFLGLAEDKINAKLNIIINTRIYDDKDMEFNNIKKDGNSYENSCAICLSDFVINDLISTLPCSGKHCFHTFCLEEWFNSNISCPLCRMDFSEKIGEVLFNGVNNNQNNEDDNFANNNE